MADSITKPRRFYQRLRQRPRASQILFHRVAGDLQGLGGAAEVLAVLVEDAADVAANRRVKIVWERTVGDCLAFHGGAVIIDHCTVAQFNALGNGRGAALRFTNYYGDNPYPLVQMRMTNSIVTGYDDDVVMGQTLEGDSTTAFSYLFENCLLRTPALEDTINCRNIIWETKDDSIQGEKHFRLIDSHDLRYDFHLDSLSTAQGKGCYD